MGNAKAQNLLGKFIALEKDYLTPVESYKWFTIAAANGHSDAKPLLDNLAKKLSPEQIAKAKEMIKKHPKMIRRQN